MPYESLDYIDDPRERYENLYKGLGFEGLEMIEFQVRGSKSIELCAFGWGARHQRTQGSTQSCRT